MPPQETAQASVPRLCLGVPLGRKAGDGVLAAPSAPDGFDIINQHLAAAIRDVQTVIQSDRSRAVSYRAFRSPVLGNGQALEAPSNVSILEDCGLPLVRSFRGFLDNVSSELTPGTVPFVGFGSASNFGIDAISPLWQEPSLLILRQFIPVGFQRLQQFHEQVSYLTRMNSSDEIWKDTQSARAGQWFSAFGGGLSGYMSALFAGQFVDRNGTAVSFDLGGVLKDAVSLDVKSVAPQTVGAIIATLAEFLGDALFGVPFYSADTLAAYRDYRANKQAATADATSLETLRKAAQNGSISAKDALGLLGLASATVGADIPVVFDRVPSGGKESPLINSVAARILLRKVDQLDADYLAQLLALSDLGDQLDSMEAGTGGLDTRFTCFKAGVIRNRLDNLFIPDPRAQGLPGRDNDTGELEGPKADNSDLVGKLVTYGGTTAEKSVRSLVGGIVRGVAIASLQNEVLAEVIDALAGTLAKKLVESVVYRGLIGFIQDPQTTPDTKRQSLTVLAQWYGLIEGQTTQSTPVARLPIRNSEAVLCGVA